MDISDEELFDATPSTSTTNTSLSLTEQTKNLTQDPIQEKDCNSILTKDISVKLTRLPNVKIQEEQTNSHSFKNKKRRFTWKYGFLKGKRLYKREKRASSSKSSKSQQAFRNIEPATEVKSGSSENRVNVQISTHLYNQSYKTGESYGDAQQDKQAAQKEIKNCILSTCQVQEENLCADETNVCARTLPYQFYQKNSITSNNVNAVKCFDSLLPSNSKNTESSSHSDKSYLSNSFPNDAKAMKKLIHTRLKFMAKRMGKQLDEWKFKRKYVTSDSETDEQSIPKRKRRIPSNDSDNEDITINSMEMIGDNNQNESHVSLKKIDEKETDIQINRTVRVILTRLEEMEDKDVIKWRESKTKLSDIIVSEPVEGQQLDRRNLVRNLVTLESRNKLILPKEDRFLETEDKDPLLINNCIERRYAKSKLNKLRKKYKLFKKPRVLMIKLDTLQCSSKNGRYSAIEIDHLTKKYVNFVINVNFHYKSHGLKMYRHVHLQRSTSDVNTTYSEDHNTSSSVSRTQNTDTRFKPPRFTEENLIKDVEATENSDENVPFKIYRKFVPIQNQYKASSSGISEKKNNTLSPKRLEMWRNAFRALITEKSQKPTASMQSTSKTLHISQNSPKKSINAEYESIFTPSIPTSSTKHNTPIGSPRKLASSKKQTEASTKPTECDDTSKPESSVNYENLPNDTNVKEIVSRSDFAQSKDSTVSKSTSKNAKDADVIISETSLNSSKKISKLHEKTNNLELSTNDMISVKSKISEVCGVEQSSHKKEQACRCHLCGASFKNDELLLKHMAMNLYKTCAIVNPTSSDASKCIEASMSNETITNKKHSQNLENSKLSTLQQQCSSVNGKSSSHQLDKSVIDSDMEIPSFSSSSSSSRGIKTHREHFRISQRKTKTKSTAKSKSDLNLNLSNREEILESKNRSTNVKLKQAICKICLQIFDTQAQLLQHMFKHFANDLRNMYTSIENKIVSEHQEFRKNKDQVSNDSAENSVEAAMGEVVEVAGNNINEQEKNLPENTNESCAENLVALEVSHEATKERNESSNLSSAEFIIERDLRKQLIASNAEHRTIKVQCAEKEKTCVAGLSLELQSTKSFTICECHRPKTNRTTGTNVQIEIVLLCTTCQTLFRRFECFESHCTPRTSAEGTLCGKNRRHGRKSKLLCVSCQKMLNSVQDLWHHLVMHSRLNRTGTATFCCNICKVIFYGLGQLFNNHFQNHAKNPFFLASRLSFPRPSYIGSKLIKLPATDNDKSIEVYMQVADHVCNECRTPFILEQALKSHKTVCQNAITTVDPRSGFSNGRGMTSITFNRVPILLICGFCNKTFYSRTSFEVHSLEHTQKRDMHIHYTCVAVTALTRVYICKVCTTMWQSLQNFEEHWLTHGVLQEEYICSRCQNHYNSIDLFQKHTIASHSDSEMQQLPITCEVIYRDINDQSSKTNPQKNTVDDLPYMDLSFFFDGEKDDAEKIANDKCESQELTHLPQSSLEKLLFRNRSTQVKAIISPELSARSNKEVQAIKNVPQIPVQIPSSNAAVAQSKRSSNSNSGNFNDDSDEEEELTIVLSESEESSISSGVRKNVDSTPSTKHQKAQENTKSTTSEPAVFDGQIQCSNDAVSVTASAKTLNDMNESSNASSNARISVITPRESVNTQLSTNVNISKDKTSVCSTSVNSTMEMQISHANKILENSVDQSVSSDTNSSREEPKESLPKNVMNSIPKSFLRVKSLAELTNTPPSENHFCGVCGLSFESRHKLRGHMAIHNRQDKQSGQISLSDNVPVWPMKPTFNPLAHISTTSTQERLPSLVPINNVSPSVSARSHPPTRVTDTVTSRQYQVVGVKPLPSVKSSTITDASKSKEPLPYEVTVSSSNNVTSTTYQQNMLQKTAYHQNLPPHISHPLNKSVQSAQQQQNTGTVAIRPFLQTTYPSLRPPLPPYSQLQPQQLQQQPQQPSQLQQQPQQQQHQPQMQQLLQQQHPQSQQLQQQQPQPLRQQSQQLQQLQQQQQPQQLQQQSQQLQQQLQQQQPQQLQQQLQQQQLQQQQQSQQLQQLQLQLQLQQQMQQQQINVGNNVVHYLISKTGMSYQLTSNNIIPPNSDNVMLVAVNTMQQISKDPERYICLYCPGFECSSVQEFTLHEHSPKHEARSHYNGVAYVPRT